MDANTLKSLKRKYFFAPLMLWYMKHCNYEKLKPTLIKAGMSHIRNESAEEIAYAQDMFETIFRDFPQEKNVHISGLLADLMNQKPVTAEDFAALAGKILLILPDQDFFSGKMQDDLKKLMHDPEVAYVSGGHLSTVVKADDYIRTIRAFFPDKERTPYPKKRIRGPFLSPRVVFIDGTHIKANANTKKQVKVQIPAASKRYAEELMEEVNADREAHGKKPFDNDDDPPAPARKRRDNTSRKKLTRRKKEKTRTVAKSVTDPKGRAQAAVCV